MSVRLPELHLLTPGDLLKAAERILETPTYNVQRASMDEIYTFAVATTQFAEVAQLAARLLAGQATPDERARLRSHLLALGVLPPGFILPTEPQES